MDTFSVLATCLHPNSVLTHRPDTNGRSRYQRQCTTCWQPTSEWIKKNLAAKESALETIPLFREDLKQKYWDDLHQLNSTQALFELKKMQPKYEEYLKSESWRAKRLLVMKRANEICEGCGIRPATQVHHFTYENLGSELLWELVAVCDECHERSHPWKLTGTDSRSEIRRQRLHRELESSPLFREQVSAIFEKKSE